MDDDGLFDELEDLLAREREVLVRGEVEGLGRLAEAKVALLERIGNGVPDRERLQRLRGAAARNGALMAAASSGIRAAQRRLRELADGPPALTTYDGAGNPRPLGAASGRVSHRA